MEKPKILIVCYTFPPFEGIGGRRWAKFAKYLEIKGYNVFVIAADQFIGTKSPWISDIKNIENNIAYIPTKYPKWLILPANTIVKKIRYRISIWQEKTFFKGNIFDRSKHWEKKLQNAVKQKIEQGYNTVIYSTPPFRGAYFIAKLKEKLTFNFIIDYRDPWTNNKTSFGFENQKTSVLEYEKKIEKYTIAHADGMLSVLPEYIDYVQSTYKINIPKTLVLPNGFDPTDFKNYQITSPKNKCRIVFAGTLYAKAMHVFKEFVNAITKIKNVNIHLYNQLQVDFYGDVQPNFIELTQHLNVIKHHGTVLNSQVFEEIASATACLLFLADDTNNTFSTKFHEYVQFKKPILVCSKAGKTGKYVETNHIGFAIEQGNMDIKLLQFLQKSNENNVSFNPNYSNNETQLPNLTNQLIQFINK